MWGKAKYNFQDILGNSFGLLKCKEIAMKASRTSSPVLVYGETGTGKEMFVQAIHNFSDRKYKPFIAENCASIPLGLLESTLFGTTKGSFTGSEDRRGLFEIAEGGTLYLDELNSMPIELQSKLLRVLQEGTMRKVGSSVIKEIDVRVVASLNEPPELLLKEGILREDLFYRLDVVRIDIPPLRNRKEDIPLLVQYFINKFNNKFSGNIEGIRDTALESLMLFDWEGNIRQLEHIIEGVFNLKLEGYINTEDLRQLSIYKRRRTLTLKEMLEQAERKYIVEALIICRNNITKTAQSLGIPRQTLQSKIKRFDIKRSNTNE